MTKLSVQKSEIYDILSAALGIQGRRPAIKTVTITLPEDQVYHILTALLTQIQYLTNEGDEVKPLREQRRQATFEAMLSIEKAFNLINAAPEA